jgi:hypothetical protein
MSHPRPQLRDHSGRLGGSGGVVMQRLDVLFCSVLPIVSALFGFLTFERQQYSAPSVTVRCLCRSSFALLNNSTARADRLCVCVCVCVCLCVCVCVCVCVFVFAAMFRVSMVLFLFSSLHAQQHEGFLKSIVRLLVAIADLFSPVASGAAQVHPLLFCLPPHFTRHLRCRLACGVPGSVVTLAYAGGVIAWATHIRIGAHTRHLHAHANVRDVVFSALDFLPGQNGAIEKRDKLRMQELADALDDAAADLNDAAKFQSVVAAKCV